VLDLPATQLLPIPERGRTHTRERTVRLGDVDVRGELRLDAIARYLQDVATDDAVDAGLGNAMGWVVRRTLIRVDRPGHLNERVALTTYCTGSGRSWAERRTSLFGGEGNGAAIEAVSLWVQIDVDTGRPARLAPDFHVIYGAAAGGRQISSKLSLPKPPDGAAAEPWRFRITDLDPYGHVNNAAQWAVMEDLLARTGRERRGIVEIEFLAAAGLHHGLVVAGDSAWLTADGSAITALRWSA
jgi:acyl-ACP thioesterase